MNLHHLAARAEKLITDNSPLILTAVGVAGTVTTAVLAARAGIRTEQILDQEERENGGIAQRSNLTKMRKLELLWKVYIPPVASASITMGAVVGANRISTRRAAALAAAYVISEGKAAEFKEKAQEKLGIQKSQKLQDEIAQEHVDAVSTQHVIVTGGQTAFMDAWSGRVFPSSMEEVKQAQNDLNKQVLDEGYATLTDFYNLIGLDSTKFSDDVGWNSDKLMEVVFSTCMSPQQTACIFMDFRTDPIRQYYKSHG